MPASPARRKIHPVSAVIVGAALAVGMPLSAAANVITDWDEKAVAVIVPMASLGKTPPDMERLMAIVHAAMFDAVNSIEPRYLPYLTQLPADPTTSKEAAAAAAAAAVLATIDTKTAGDMQTALAAYLASIPEAPDTGRTWDYRYCWPRDAYFTTAALSAESLSIPKMQTLFWWLHLVIPTVRIPNGASSGRDFTRTGFFALASCTTSSARMRPWVTRSTSPAQRAGT